MIGSKNSISLGSFPVRPTVAVAAVAFLALALSSGARAADEAKAAAAAAEKKPPAELKKTVDAFAGHWTYDGTVTAPGGKPVKAAFQMTCKKGALGKAVACLFGGNIPGSGPYDASILVGFDTLHKNVHFMAMTSDEEVHDHVCNWKSATELVCDPLRGGLMGDEITEDFSLMFNGDRGSFRSVMKMKDGSQVVFDAAGKRAR